MARKSPSGYAGTYTFGGIDHSPRASATKASRTASRARAGETAASTSRAAKSGTTTRSGIEALHVTDQLRDRVLGVAEEHDRLRVEEERILDPGEAGLHAPLEHDDALRGVDVQDRHPVDRASLVVAGVRVDHVVGADDEHDVGAG